MVLDFTLLGLLGGGFYGLTYFLLRREDTDLAMLLLNLRELRASTLDSFLTRWAFHGSAVTQERVAHLFTVFPPLMLVATFLALVRHCSSLGFYTTTNEKGENE